MMPEQMEIPVENKNPSPYLMLKNYFKWIRYLNVKAKTGNILGEIIGDNLSDFGVGEYFLVWTQKA